MFGVEMDRAAAVERDGQGLWELLEDLPDGDSEIEMSAEERLAALVVRSAWLRRESRGSHFRTDFRETEPEWRGRIHWKLGMAPDL